jgi:hypothetical protein
MTGLLVTPDEVARAASSCCTKIPRPSTGSLLATAYQGEDTP